MAAKKNTGKDATLSDVVAQLQKIEAALDRLTGALQRSGPTATASAAAAPPPPASPAVSAPKPAAKKAAASPRGATKSPEKAAKPRPKPAASEPRESALDGEDPSLRETVGRVLSAGLIEDVDDCWAVLEALTHPKALHGPRSIDHLKAFSWKKLRRTASDYLRDGDMNGFRIDRVAPLPSEEGVTVVKVFIESHDGSPAPVTLRRDDDSDEPWRVFQISL